MSERYVVTKESLDAYELAASAHEEARLKHWRAEDAFKVALCTESDAREAKLAAREAMREAGAKLRAEKLASPSTPPHPLQSIMGSDGHCVRSGSVVVDRKTGGNVRISLAHVGGIKFRDGMVHIERADLDDLIAALQAVAKSRPT